MKKFLCVLLVFCTLVAPLSVGAFASSQTRTEAQVTALVEKWLTAEKNFLKEKGASTAYWNKGLNEAKLESQVNNGQYAACLTTTKGTSNSNYFKGSTCNGFARYMRYVVFKEDGAWGDEYAKSKLDKAYCLKCGDILRINGSSTGSHYVFVYKIVYNATDSNKDVIYFIEANWDGQCGVGTRHMTRSELWKVLYQVWGNSPTTIGTLSYNANGGTGTTMKSKTLKGTLSRKIVLPACTYTNEGKTFLGWDENPNATTPTYKAGDAYRLLGNTTLYAIWETDESKTVTGWQKEGGVWYYYDATGAKKTNCWISGTYYLKSDGSMAVSEWVDGGQYYVDANGAWVKGKTKSTGSWQKNSVGWWYKNADGTYPASAWKQISGSWYYFNASGYMVTGWQKIGGTWYYFNASGAMVTGWQKIGSSWYYFNTSGAMKSNAWIGNYYVKSDGSMATSEWVDGGRYYVGADGKWVDN